MEENEIMLLKNSKMYVTRVGRWMNTFSILSVVAMFFLVIGGILMLYASKIMDEATAFYGDNIMGLGGIGLIVGAAAIVPAVLFMRRAVNMAKQIKISQELYPIVGFLRETQKLWHYTCTVMIVIVVLAVIAGVLGVVYILPLIH